MFTRIPWRTVAVYLALTVLVFGGLAAYFRSSEASTAIGIAGAVMAVLALVAASLVGRARDEASQLSRSFHEMDEALRAHVDAVEEERGRLAAVLVSMADGLVITDPDGIVRL